MCCWLFRFHQQQYPEEGVLICANITYSRLIGMPRQAQKSATAAGGKARRTLEKQIRVVEMQLAMEEADVEQGLAAARRDLRRQLLVWEQVTVRAFA